MKLKARFSLFSSMLVLFVVLSISALLLLAEKQHPAGEAEKNNIALVKGLERVSRESLLRDDDLFLINYVKTVKKNNGIVAYALFVDSGNRILAHNELRFLRQVVNENNILSAQKHGGLLVRDNPGEIIDISIPVFLGNARKGTALIGFSRAAIDKDIREMLSLTARRIAVVALITLALGLLGALLLAHAMARPIKALSGGAKLIGEGRLDTKINVRGRDELALLAEEFNRMAEKLKELDQMKRDFVSSVTHELRSPLSAIESYVSDMLDGGLEQFRKTGVEDLSLIKNNAIRLSYFINDLLDTAKIESSRMDINRKNIDIGPVINDVTALFRSKSEKSNINLGARIQQGLPEAFADEDRIRQVIINLVGNSLKFTPAGGEVIVSAELIPDAGRQSPLIRIAVTDSGIGIPEDKFEAIFDKFEQLKGSRDNARGAKGTGLGLFIVKNIVELHGGKIRVESPPAGKGKGSSFIFTLPVFKKQNSMF